MDAAAIESTSASPLITATQSQPTSMRSTPSTNTSCGATGSALTARASAHSDAPRILSVSMREGGAMATATSAVRQIFSYSSLRRSAVSFLESLRPFGMRLGSRMTAAATTGPASGPLPASSHPATGNTPRFIAARSRVKVGRTISSPKGSRAAGWRLIAAIFALIAAGTQSPKRGVVATGAVGSVENPPRVDHHGLAGHRLGAAHRDHLVGDVILVGGLLEQ